MNKTEIYCFSGTGNSLKTAKELQKLIPEAKLIPVMSLLKKDVIETDGETVGFVFPLHAYTFPIPMDDFFKKLDVKSAGYIFAVATRGGSPCNVFKNIDKILKAKGKELNAGFFIDMPNNYLPGFELETKEEIEILESGMMKRLELIHKTVINKEKNPEKDHHGNVLRENILNPLISILARVSRYGNIENSFYADSKCTGCKICEKVCLSGKIKMTGGKPEWQKDVKCTFCFACINYCPEHSIQLRNYKTEGKGRYFNSDVKAAEIAGQKISVL
jgi:ferredoxin